MPSSTTRRRGAGLLLSLAAAAALAQSGASADDAVAALTAKNYDSATAGKTVFVKFFAPWCAHCKRMAPAWEMLAQKWKGSDVGLVAEVDCTIPDGKKLCDYHDIQSFPTLMYGSPDDLEDYNGGRAFEVLAAFADENLVPLCDPHNLHLCDEATASAIAKYMAMPSETLRNLVSTEERKLKEAEEKFSSKLAEMQEMYHKLEEEKKEAVAAIRDGDLGMMKMVSKARTRRNGKQSEEL